MFAFFAGPGDLAIVLVCLNECGVVTRWKKIGALLGLLYSNLQMIQKDESDEENRLIAMLNLWLKTGTATKQALMSAMRSIR